MKVDVTTPDDEPRVSPEAGHAADADRAPEPAVAPDEVEADVIDDVEPADEPTAKKAAEDAVFSIADIEAAQAAAAEANERFLRLQAEWDNYRKRTAREREDERVRAAEDLVEKLLPVIDDIERAIDHAAKSEPTGEFAQFVEGVAAMHSKFVAVLEKKGVEVIDPRGQEFDLNEHQAVANIDDPSLPDSTVRDVYQKGYRMGGHVIRPAMVTVSKGGPARATAPSEEAADGVED